MFKVNFHQKSWLSLKLYLVLRVRVFFLLHNYIYYAQYFMFSVSIGSVESDKK